MEDLFELKQNSALYHHQPVQRSKIIKNPINWKAFEVSLTTEFLLIGSAVILLPDPEKSTKIIIIFRFAY